MGKWEVVNFEEVVDNFDGKRVPIKASERKNTNGGKYPYYGASGIIDYVDDYIFEGEHLLISEDGANLLARVYPVAFIADGKFWVNNHAHIVKAKEGKTTNDFLEYYFSSIDISEYVTGAAQPKLNQRKLNSIKIPLPPLAEQQRIVTKLDTLFADIDQAIGLLEENIAHTQALIGSVLDEEFGKLEKLSSKKEKLKKITTKIGSGSTPRGGQKSYKQSGISLIRSMNVHDCFFKEKNLAFIDEAQADKLRNVEIQENDVLLNITGASVARCCIVDPGYLPARVNQHVSIIRTDKNILPEFILYFLVSPKMKSKLLYDSAGNATREAITKSMIESIEVPIVSLENQQGLIDKIKESFKLCDELTKTETEKLTHLRYLKSSLLDQAFKGEL